MRIRTRNERVRFFNGQESLSLLHISDVHVWFSGRVLDELKRIIFKTGPDLIILTGDYYDTSKGAHLFKAFMSEVASSFTIVFIKGNHDFFWGEKVSGQLLDIPNCFYVEDDLFSFVSQRGNKYNIGAWKHRGLFENKSNEKNIVLIHNPEKLNTRELKHIDLILAGHLHGGQFIFFTYGESHYPGSFLYKYCTDRKQINDTTLIVSKGIGDTFPFRFNCPKEIVSITIE
jgi:predicted MPP superfamily phosphohydrolase